MRRVFKYSIGTDSALLFFEEDGTFGWANIAEDCWNKPTTAYATVKDLVDFTIDHYMKEIKRIYINH